MSTKDRNFRPSRRRSFDDDNYQPPTRDFGFASRPSVLRFETPSGPPVRAIVKWYNPDKGTERASLEKKPSMRLSHDPCVGVNVKAAPHPRQL